MAVTVHADAIHIGSLFDGDLSAVVELAEAIDKGDIPCRATKDIGKDIWAKMLYNCVAYNLVKFIEGNKSNRG